MSAIIEEKEKGYQGWANYETWATVLWIGNDEVLYHEVQRMAKGHYDKNKLAQALKEMFEDLQVDLGPSLWSDLLNAAMGEIDWYEIAEHLMEEEE